MLTGVFVKGSLLHQASFIIKIGTVHIENALVELSGHIYKPLIIGNGNAVVSHEVSDQIAAIGANICQLRSNKSLVRNTAECHRILDIGRIADIYKIRAVLHDFSNFPATLRIFTI